MTIYNKTRHIISVRSIKTGQRIKLMPGANPNVTDVQWADMKVSLKGHVEAGYISLKASAIKSGAPDNASAGSKIKEKDLLKIVEETFDIDALENIIKDTGSDKVKKTAKAQIKEINKK